MFEVFMKSLAGSAIFGIVGVFIVLLGFKAFEWITRSLKVEEELVKGNVAVGVVVGGLFVALGLCVAGAIS